MHFVAVLQDRHTHVENTIETADGKGCRKHSDREGNTGIAPSAIRVQCVEHELRGTTFCQNTQCSDDSNKEQNVKYTAKNLKIINNRP